MGAGRYALTRHMVINDTCAEPRMAQMCVIRRLISVGTGSGRSTALHRHELGNVPAHGADVAIIGEDVRQAEQEEDAGVEEQHVVDGGRHQRC